MTFYEKVLSLCRKNGISLNKLALSCGFSRSVSSSWKLVHGNPRQATAKKLADYFGVPVEYFYYDDLTNDEKQPTAAPSAPVDAMEQELLSVFHSLDMKRKTALLSKAYELQEERANKA